MDPSPRYDFEIFDRVVSESPLSYKKVGELTCRLLNEEGGYGH